MKPKRPYYDRTIGCWLQANPLRRFTEYRVAEAFAVAYMEKQLLCQQRLMLSESVVCGF